MQLNERSFNTDFHDRASQSGRLAAIIRTQKADTGYTLDQDKQQEAVDLPLMTTALLTAQTILSAAKLSRS
jgi:hypothetical protein